MKIAQINMMHTGSTGKIMFGISETLRLSGNVVQTFSPKYFRKGKRNDFPSISNHNYFGFINENWLHNRLSRVLGLPGFFSVFGTLQLVTRLKTFNPDVIHIHNIHNWTINIPILFHYIKKYNIPLVWTLHDCWAFTAKCPYFTIAQCDKWKYGCGKCVQTKEYPQTWIDNTKWLWKMKKKYFTGIKKCTIVTPSEWLGDLVKQSFLKEYPIMVINNGIDLQIFKNRESEFIKKNRLTNKYVILGVAFDWGIRKGLDVFVRLANMLDEERYAIVLVGINERQASELPNNILSINKTNNQIELAEIYSAANLFLNPTREENYPTVNMESIACGTPVLTFDTGGSAEIISNHTGDVVECDDIDMMYRKIIDICENHKYNKRDCIDYSKKFEMSIHFKEYIKVYEKII